MTAYMILVPMNFGFSCQFFFIQIFLKILILIFNVSLLSLSDDMDNGEPRHPSHVIV